MTTEVRGAIDTMQRSAVRGRSGKLGRLIGAFALSALVAVPSSCGSGAEGEATADCPAVTEWTVFGSGGGCRYDHYLDEVNQYAYHLERVDTEEQIELVKADAADLSPGIDVCGDPLVADSKDIERRGYVVHESRVSCPHNLYRALDYWTVVETTHGRFVLSGGRYYCEDTDDMTFQSGCPLSEETGKTKSAVFADQQEIFHALDSFASAMNDG